MRLESLVILAAAGVVLWLVLDQQAAAKLAERWTSSTVYNRNPYGLAPSSNSVFAWNPEP